jgi:hypothetical protein
MVPVVLFGVVGLRTSASFFLGVAVYLGVLKWVGWILLTRRSERPAVAIPSFPIELMGGLAAVCAWFYVRNLVAGQWHLGYGLGELSALAILVIAGHLAATCWRIVRFPWRDSAARAEFGRTLLRRTAWTAPVCFLLTVSLLSISMSLSVQSSDPIFHAYTARWFYSDGVFGTVESNGPGLAYPTGYGAMNATALALSPLNVVQSINAQHVVWLCVALYLIATTVAARAVRPLAWLPWLPVAFAAIFPIYALFPDVCYEGTPRQVAPALLAGVCLMPLLVRPATRARLCVIIAVETVLSALIAALNPACIPFAAAALLFALIVHGWRSAQDFKKSALALIPAMLVLIALLGILVIICDPYYLGMLKRYRKPAPVESAALALADERTDVPTAPEWHEPTGFSRERALAASASVRPWELTPVATMVPLAPEHKPLLRWPYGVVQRIVLAVSFLLGGLALVPVVLRRPAASTARPFAPLLIGTLCLWLLAKYLFSALAAGVMGDGAEAELFRTYVRFLLLRCELLMLFTMLASGAAACYLFVTALALRPVVRMTILLPGLVALGSLVLVAGQTLTSGRFLIPRCESFAITEEDRRLVDWIDANIPPTRGKVALAATTFHSGHGWDEHHLYPAGGAVAPVFYSRQRNYRFAIPGTEGEAGYQDYLAHFQKHFDAEWCLANEIHFVYVTRLGLEQNPGLAQAVKEGKELRPLRQEGTSVVYEVVKEGP